MEGTQEGQIYHQRSDVYKLYLYCRDVCHGIVGVVYNNQKEWKKLEHYVEGSG